ncbi:hypothetical protein PHMEG_00029896 [Phytophthora megakarya]|uniref:Uncharacterized protein n=1 Tax=Phytophthora megakarya TaxID=4795 RepID=A0A225V337_9STRA|nr:hypothetical protein PHMEG_00029896 [Phytophthora megakarya]
MYLTSMEQRAVTGKSTFDNVRSGIVYLHTTIELFPAHHRVRHDHGSASGRMFVTIDSIQFVTSRAASSSTTTESQVPSVSAMQGELYAWDGSFHRVPKAFLLPSFGALGSAIETTNEALYVIQIEERPVIITNAFNVINSDMTNT